MHVHFIHHMYVVIILYLDTWMCNNNNKYVWWWCFLYQTSKENKYCPPKLIKVVCLWFCYCYCCRCYCCSCSCFCYRCCLCSLRKKWWGYCIPYFPYMRASTMCTVTWLYLRTLAGLVNNCGCCSVTFPNHLLACLLRNENLKETSHQGSYFNYGTVHTKHCTVCISMSKTCLMSTSNKCISNVPYVQ